MKSLWPVLLLVLIFICLFAYVFLYRSDVPLETSQKSTTLPLKDNAWREAELSNENSNSSTYVLELKHGWLVYHNNGFGGGMAFVPKPQ